MVKITVKNYQESKDYRKIVMAVGKILARQRHVSPIEDAYARHFVVVGKRNPFAEAEEDSTPDEPF